jgi:signal transduction histidine kinase
VQEALNNAAKHSGTKGAEVEMIFSSGTLTVNVKDFGRGMQARKQGKPGLGLIAMRERAELLSGSLEILSVAGAGTTVSLVMPTRQEDHVTETMQDQTIEQVLSRT